MPPGTEHAWNQPPWESTTAIAEQGLAAFFHRLGLEAEPGLDGGSAEQRARLYRALVFLESHLGSRIRVREIAAAACYAPRHFQRVFQETFGESVHRHLARLRMQKSEQLLAFFDMPVAEVALAVGYDSASVFTRAFAAHHGCAPTVWREKHRSPHRFDGANARPPGEAPLAVRFGDFPTLRVAFLRHIGHPGRALPVWLKLLAWAWKKNLLRDREVLPLCIYHDADECAPERNRCDICVSVPGDFDAGDCGVGIKDIPGGMVMMHDFKGNAAAFEARWHLLCDVWLPQSGWRLREEFAFDLFAPHQLAPRKLAIILAARDPAVESTLCVPVERM